MNWKVCCNSMTTSKQKLKQPKSMHIIELVEQASKKEGKIENVQRLLMLGILTDQQICNTVGATIDFVLEIKKNLPNI